MHFYVSRWLRPSAISCCARICPVTRRLPSALGNHGNPCAGELQKPLAALLYPVLAELVRHLSDWIREHIFAVIKGRRLERHPGCRHRLLYDDVYEPVARLLLAVCHRWHIQRPLFWAGKTYLASQQGQAELPRPTMCSAVFSQTSFSNTLFLYVKP